MISIVTGNIKKFTEMQHALSAFDIAVEQVQVDVPELQTRDHEAVIRAKTAAAYAATQRPVLVDDSGFYIERYQQFPGVYTKDVYKMIGYDGLRALTSEGDAAEFRCFVGYMDETLNEPMIFRGVYAGSVTHDFDSEAAAKTHAEMPYVVLFVPDIQPNTNASKSLAYFSEDERSIDHRHQALQAFAQWYRSR